MASPFRYINKIESFDGGLNNKYEPNIIEDNESPDCLNVVFDDLGAVQTREGFSKLNTTPMASAAVDGLYTTKFNDGSNTMIAWCDGNMYALNTTTFVTVPSAQSVFTAGQRVDFTMYQNYVFMGNGASTYKYNGTEFTQHGVIAPVSFPTPNVSSAGTLSGTYRYKVTYLNSSNVESDISTFASNITLANELCALTGVPIAPASYGVNARNLYRTLDLDTAVASSSYYFITVLNDNTTTTYEDGLGDASVGAAAPTDQGTPPAYKFILSFQERLFAVTDDNPQYLYYSDLGEPFTWPSTNFIKIADGDGEKITGLSVQGNSLVIYKEDSIWLLYMPDTTASNWQRVKTNSKYGCASHFSISDYENLTMFLGQKNKKLSGFYAFTGLAIDQDATQLTVGNMYSDSKSDRIEPELSDFQSAYKENCVAIQYDNKIWIAVTKGSGETANNYIYQFDYIRRGKSRRLGSWVPFNGIDANDFTVYDSDLYFGDSSDDGFVFKLNDGSYNDDGSAIDSYYWTKEFEGSSRYADYEKDFRYANFVVETLGDWEMTITYKIDSDKGGGDTENVDLNPGGSLWGTMVWGRDDWGGGQARSNTKVELGQSVGKKIQFKFDNQNTADQGFKVLRGNFYFNLRGLR